MLDLKTGRFFVGNGNIIYSGMRKKEFFQTNFFIDNLIEEKELRESEIYHIKGYDFKEMPLDIEIKFDCKNDFVDELLVSTENFNDLISELGIEKNSISECDWGKIIAKGKEVVIKFNNEKFIR